MLIDTLKEGDDLHAHTEEEKKAIDVIFVGRGANPFVFQSQTGCCF